MAEKLAELFGDEPTPQAEPTPAAPEVKAPEPPQAATPPAVAASEPPKPAEPARPDPGYVPLAAMLDEREKRRKAEERAAALEAQTRKPQAVPSVQDDPDAYAEHVNGLVQRATISERFSISEVMATDKHGADTVKAAMDWGMERARTSPAFAAEYMQQKHPIDWAVRQHKRELRNAEIGDDFDAYLEREAAKRGWSKNPAAPPVPAPNGAAPAAPQPVAPSKPPPPSPSLASAPSAGGPSTSPTPRRADLERLGLND